MTTQPMRGSQTVSWLALGITLCAAMLLGAPRTSGQPTFTLVAASGQSAPGTQGMWGVNMLTPVINDLGQVLRMSRRKSIVAPGDDVQ